MVCKRQRNGDRRATRGPPVAGAAKSVKIAGFSANTPFTKDHTMGNKIVTEAMRKATPPLPGATVAKQGVGQRKSLERGSHTRSKKNPGKRPHQG
jgi:hypothetical protein